MRMAGTAEQPVRRAGVIRHCTTEQEMRTNLQMAVAKAPEQSVQWSTPEAALAKALAALRLMLTAMVVLAVLTANAFAYTGVELECIAQAHAMTPHGFYEVKLITWEVPHT